MEVLDKKKILVIQTAFLGDAVLTLPMLEILSRQNPDAIIDVVTIPQNVEIFLASPFVHEVLVYDKRRIHKGWKALLNFSSELSHRQYDIIIAPHRSLRTSLLVLFSRIENSVGYDKAVLNLVYKNIVPYRYNMHEVSRNVSLVSQGEYKNISTLLPKVKYSAEVMQNVDAIISQISASEKLIAIAPGSVWETKRYPKEYFVEVCNGLAQKNYVILLIGSKNEVELNEKIKSQVKGECYNLASKFSLVETMYLLTKCLLLVTNDSAPTHFGMAANIPVLTIYCSTVPAFGFYPYNGKSESIEAAALPCKPCGIHGYKTCPLRHFDCGKKLFPEEVLKKIDSILQRN